MSSVRGSLDRIYQDNVTTQAAVATLGGHLDDARELILRGWVTPAPRARASFASQLVSAVLPEVELEIAQIGNAASDNPVQAKIAHDLATRWVEFRTLWAPGQWGQGPAAGHTAHAAAVVASFDALNTDGNRIMSLEKAEGVSGNSADRLEPVTAVEAGSLLLDRLTDAQPRDCLAIRAASTHIETPDHEPLLGGELCGASPGRSTCTPLLVGGEVIGSVLVKHENALTADASTRIGESVQQAAPVIANLRNLAISTTGADGRAHGAAEPPRA